MAFIGLNTSAQDVIVKRNGEELQCKILEVSKNEVKYKRWTNQDGPSFAEKKSDIFMIKYENGEKAVGAYESPALAVPSVTPNLSTSVPSKMTLADPTPISNVYLGYTSRGRRKSGIIKWGHMQSDEQAQSLLTNDWLDYKTARKEERTGKVLAITGGSLLLGGLWWTVYHIVYCKRYSDTEKEYDEKFAKERLLYDQSHKEYLQVYEDYTTAKSEYLRLDRQLYNMGSYNDEYYLVKEARRKAENDMEEASNRLYYLEFYSNEEYRPVGEVEQLGWDLDWYASEKETSLIPMLGGLTTGSALLIVGIIKAKRGHRNATQIVSKHKDEYEKSSKKTSMSKPEFNIGAKGNNLAFTLTF